MELAVLALAVMAALTGAGAYGCYVEHPARRELLDGPMLQLWKAGIDRSGRLQKILALAGAFLGVLAAVWGVKALFLTGALFSIAVKVVDSRYVGPVTRTLMETDPDAADAATRALLEKWVLLQAGLTGIAFLAACSFIAGLV